MPHWQIGPAAVVIIKITLVVVLFLTVIGGLVWLIGRSAKRRQQADAKRAAEIRIGHLRQLMRRQTRSQKNEDRRLVPVTAQLVRNLATKHGVELSPTAVTEMERLSFMARTDALINNPESADPLALHRVVNPNEPGTVGITINEEAAPKQCSRRESIGEDFGDDEEAGIVIEIEPETPAAEFVKQKAVIILGTTAGGATGATVQAGTATKEAATSRSSLMAYARRRQLARLTRPTHQPRRAAASLPVPPPSDDGDPDPPHDD
ncbi:hypothetical protein A3C96_01780 [Candidatus Uhrbacteria bacterium RIFCSPHIGHO2_02_FULL_60_10]|uniref:Uncharacterized protein n=1 Tax=Candidatus Uhrbacteria bacterium RIFCSPHIGHO2_02_FULL_60_10 TaxID=1802392 RepID=A0A1F7U8H7_9BACT|nr:MAG: hypothetical protein A3C96_01780 [Candidatus Uhrbacteria bacterium RIFCSPHIGHO2_02_FULL_60_10]